ncbi:hypothetical protein EXW28_27815 (plasmid) [Bacillus mycoides]|uniref:hypothetical protein n=1 Tax=Bacillus mycoides TaxID=1405 RepID=UPI001C01AF9D|nr:hypothetical protein [Bacillus mycoides]QWG53587.1 hypothetical protein EXW37_27805 [Bacillus mycoides]QWG64913.1 hypothetical protein EXW60_29335 [Bacillus mycoides]QWH37394.1 hypothetical protein EXW28_27815 [Bacillus mycoides]QWJ09291.1 hypothetical protein J5V76_28610 [Bacillus mycoides]HDR7594541.1 hypothetical protein [Bacillus mycoides]
METQVSKSKKKAEFLRSVWFWVFFIGILYLFKAFILQIIGILLIIAFTCLGFYYLGYLLFAIISLIIVVGSVIFAICILGYFL